MSVCLPTPSLEPFLLIEVSHLSGVLGVKTSLRVTEQDFNDLNFLEALHAALTHTHVHTHVSYMG